MYETNFLYIVIITDELLNLFETFKLADEVRFSQHSENFLRSNSPEIILSWLSGDSFKDINKKYFKKTNDLFSDTVIFCESYIRNYANWISFAIYMVLKDHLNHKLGALIKNLPFFLTYGTFNLLNGLFQALKISSRTPALKKLGYHLIKKYPALVSDHIYVIMNKLTKLEFSDFLFSEISEFELKEIEIIWNKFNQTRKNQLFTSNQ